MDNESKNDINNNIAGLNNWNKNNNQKTAMLSYKDYDVYKNIHSNATTLRKMKDKQIALVASAHNFDIFVTNDGTYHDDYLDAGKKAMRFNEFMIYLKSNKFD